MYDGEEGQRGDHLTVFLLNLVRWSLLFEYKRYVCLHADVRRSLELHSNKIKFQLKDYSWEGKYLSIRGIEKVRPTAIERQKKPIVY